MLAEVCQVLASTVKRCLIGRSSSAQNLTMQGEELLLIKVYLQSGLSRVTVLVHHKVLEHAVLVKDLVINFLIKEPHGIVGILLASLICWVSSLSSTAPISLLVEEDVTEAWLVSVSTGTQMDTNALILITVDLCRLRLGWVSRVSLSMREPVAILVLLQW